MTQCDPETLVSYYVPSFALARQHETWPILGGAPAASAVERRRMEELRTSWEWRPWGGEERQQRHNNAVEP